MKLLAIDPGNKQSAYVVYENKKILEAGISPNQELLYNIKYDFLDEGLIPDHLAIEMVACYGMAVGETVFDTCVWIGRFIQAFNGDFTQVYRKDVKMHLCNSMKAKDANVRQAIIDKYPPIGGGKIPQIGIKKQPGLLYGFHDDMWAALGVAITFSEIKGLTL